MLNLSELKTQVGRLMQRSTDASYIANIIPDFINYAQKYLGDSYDYFQELEATHTFSTVSGTANYYMPSWFDKPYKVYNLTSTAPVDPITEQEYSDGNISNIASSTTGQPTQYRMYGTKGISSDLSSGITVQVKSSSAADTTSPVVRVEGYIDSAKTILGYENITVSSATPTTFNAGSTTFYEITHVSKSADTVGTIIVADDSSSTIASLGPTERTANYKRMILGLIPNGVYSIKVLLKKRVIKLKNDYDYPFMDADDFIITHATAYGFAQDKETLDRSTQMYQKSNELLGIIMKNQMNRFGSDYNRKVDSLFLQSHRR